MINNNNEYYKYDSFKLCTESVLESTQRSPVIQCKYKNILVLISKSSGLLFSKLSNNNLTGYPLIDGVEFFYTSIYASKDQFRLCEGYVSNKL